jgi:hypothetical protein
MCVHSYFIRDYHINQERPATVKGVCEGRTIVWISSKTQQPDELWIEIERSQKKAADARGRLSITFEAEVDGKMKFREMIIDEDDLVRVRPDWKGSETVMSDGNGLISWSAMMKVAKARKIVDATPSK